MAKEKTFKDYFTESMKAALIPDELIPSSLFSGSAAAVANITVWAEAAKMIGARATLQQLVSAVMVGGGPGAGGGTLMAIGAAKAAAGVLAAYWLGCVIGAVLYAIQMTTIGDSWMDKFSSTDAVRLMDHAKTFGFKLPEGASDSFMHASIAQKEKVDTA